MNNELSMALADAPKSLRDEFYRMRDILNAEHLSFEDALNIAKGCHDYSGGYRFDNDLLDAFHAGISVVVNSLKAAKERDQSDYQTVALLSIGRSEK